MQLSDERINLIVSEFLEPDEAVIAGFDENRRERLNKAGSEERRKELYTSGVLIEKIRPSGAVLCYGEHGKPYFRWSYEEGLGENSANEELIRRFNLTHSAGKVFCVWSDELELGVDFESADRIINSSVVRRLCTETEIKYYKEIESAEKAGIWLLKLFTRKEAISKLYGKGMHMDFRAIADESGDYSVITEEIENGYLSIAYSEMLM